MGGNPADTSLVQAKQAPFDSETTYDFSRVMISGHSLGGGMLPYIATKVVEAGWGTNQLVLDIEAGAFDTLKGNLTSLPNNTIANVVVYDNDDVVPACITANLFERIYTKDGTGRINASFIMVRTDYHGYPRELASHYSFTDLVQDSIYKWAIPRRLDAMAIYLIQPTAQALSVILEDTNMGIWSDGKLFNSLFRTDDPFAKRGGSGI